LALFVIVESLVKFAYDWFRRNPSEKCSHFDLSLTSNCLTDGWIWSDVTWSHGQIDGQIWSHGQIWSRGQMVRWSDDWSEIR
jgi:hypothetical protein